MGRTVCHHPICQISVCFQLALLDCISSVFRYHFNCWLSPSPYAIENTRSNRVFLFRILIKSVLLFWARTANPFHHLYNIYTRLPVRKHFLNLIKLHNNTITHRVLVQPCYFLPLVNIFLRFEAKSKKNFTLDFKGLFCIYPHSD